MKRVLFSVALLGLFASAPVLFESKAEACAAPWWVNDTCGCLSSTWGYDGCGTNGITCIGAGFGCGDGPGRSPL